jgi:GT2 family glycosyltransferase
MHVTCIIPTYNGRQLLEKHLPAVEKALKKGDELLIADDASTDDTLIWLKQRYDLEETTTSKNIERVNAIFSGKHKDVDVTVMSNIKNKRFAATCNEAALIAKHDLLLLLNNDVEPSKNIIDVLAPHFVNKDVFGVGCLEDEHGNVGGKNILWFERGLFRHNRAPNFTTGETAWVSGGSGMFSKAKWEKLGGFDVGFYPAYWEDVDISFRARQKGWKILFDEKAHVEHIHESTNASVFGQQLMKKLSWRHGQYFTWKNGNLLQKLQFLLWWPYNQWRFARSLK